MIPDLTPRSRHVAFALLFSIASVSDGLAKTSRPAAEQTAVAEAEDSSSTASELAAQVSEIAHSSAISRAKKEKRISTAVRIAVVAATAYKQKSADVLSVALELTDAASRAAPGFADIIANAVSFTPALSRIDAAPGQIRNAAYAAAKKPNSPRKTQAAASAPRKSSTHSTRAPETSEVSSGHLARTVPDDEPEPEVPVRHYTAESTLADEPSVSAKSSPGSGNTAFNITADLSVSHDDNIYLSNLSPVGDTIVAVTPGIAFSFGQNSLAHGSLNYSSAFTHYLNNTSPNVTLGNGAGTFGYDSGTVAIKGDASYQELNQSNNDALVTQQAIYRSNVLGLNASVESHLTAKTSVMSGINYNKTKYKTAGLIGSQETEIPLKFYFETTPKVSLSTGFAIRHVNPQNGGERGRDLDYNVGARGNFTAKLNGEISADYRTRTVGNNPKENLWGLNGAVHYELTPKTTSSLSILNDFSTSAQGQSLNNSSYNLSLSSDLTPQWQLGANLAYRRTQYGPTLFSPTPNPLLIPAQIDRNDKYWAANLQATYLFRSWLSATATYSHRLNNSNLTLAEYADNVLSLMVTWRY